MNMRKMNAVGAVGSLRRTSFAPAPVAIIFLAITLIFSAGCRYSYKSPVGEKRSKISVGIIGNKTIENDITPVVRTQILRQLAARAPVNIVEPRPGIHMLSGDIIGYSRSNLRSDANARAAEFRLTILVEFVFHDDKGKVLWQKTLYGEDTFSAGDGSELAAQRGAVDDIVIKLIHALFPVW